MTYSDENATLIRLNLNYPQAIPENKDRTISFDEDVEEIWIIGFQESNFSISHFKNL